MNGELTRAQAPSVAMQRVAFRAATGLLQRAIPYLPLMQNDFDATAARRELIEVCVQVADQYGDEVRHGSP